jgi:hypothetical protein
MYWNYYICVFWHNYLALLTNLVVNFTVNEYDPAGTPLLSALSYNNEKETAMAFDEDYNPITLSLHRNDQNCFQIVNNFLSKTSIGASTINYLYGRRVYSIDIAITDQYGGTTIQTFDINVQDRNNPPVITNVLPLYVEEETNNIYVCATSSGNCDAAVGGPGAILGVDGVTSYDPNNCPTDITTYSLSSDAGGRFVIESSTERIKVAPNANLDFESITQYSYSAFGNTPDVVATSSGITTDETPRSSPTSYNNTTCLCESSSNIFFSLNRSLLVFLRIIQKVFQFTETSLSMILIMKIQLLEVSHHKLRHSL